MRCGTDARNWRGYDHTITSSIPYEQRPYCDWNISFQGAFKNHLVLPLRNDYSSPDHTQAVALFRDPRRRLVSGWNDNKHSYSMGTYNSPRGPIDEVAVMRNTTQTVEEYAAWPGIGGCQTKMLLGDDCSVPLNITEALFDEAHRRLLNMPFVGKWLACKLSGPVSRHRRWCRTGTDRSRSLYLSGVSLVSRHPGDPDRRCLSL